jgi:hypothetical protein
VLSENLRFKAHGLLGFNRLWGWFCALRWSYSFTAPVIDET